MVRVTAVFEIEDSEFIDGYGGEDDQLQQYVEARLSEIPDAEGGIVEPYNMKIEVTVQ